MARGPERREGLGGRLRSLWGRLRGRSPVVQAPRDDELPPEEPALVGAPPRPPHPAGSAEAEPPEPYAFEDHADHPRRDGA